MPRAWRHSIWQTASNNFISILVENDSLFKTVSIMFVGKNAALTAPKCKWRPIHIQPWLSGPFSLLQTILPGPPSDTSEQICAPHWTQHPHCFPSVPFLNICTLGPCVSAFQSQKSGQLMYYSSHMLFYHVQNLRHIHNPAVPTERKDSQVASFWWSDSRAEPSCFSVGLRPSGLALWIRSITQSCTQDT